jgi:hypothetical protein
MELKINNNCAVSRVNVYKKRKWQSMHLMINNTGAFQDKMHWCRNLIHVGVDIQGTCIDINTILTNNCNNNKNLSMRLINKRTSSFVSH